MVDGTLPLNELKLRLRVTRSSKFFIDDGKFPSKSLSRSRNNLNTVKPPISGCNIPVNALLFATKYFKFFSLYRFSGRGSLKLLLSTINSSKGRRYIKLHIKKHD